jgi:tRNA pseudouridine55 synthase
MTMSPSTTNDAGLNNIPGEVLLVDKPSGWTSFDVVNKLRRSAGGLKMGHAGTLDPMATGLLIICTGRKRKEIDRFMGLDKEYVAELRLGIRTASFDSETEPLEELSTEGITEERVRDVVREFLGPQMQIPPMWSAVQVGGRRLYSLARKGVEIDRPARPIVVHTLELVEYAVPRLVLRVACSKGTYVRSLANDIGVRLGCGACLTALRRTRIGPYGVDDAFGIAQAVAHLEASLARTL